MSEFNITTVTNPSYYNNVVDPQSVNKYLFVSNLYEGSAGVSDGSYLIPYERELFYPQRKMLSSYRNFMKPIVNAIIEPVFSSNVTRTTSNTIFKSFLEDVDNRGTTMTSNAQDVVTLARLHGVTFVVVDNFKAEEIPLTEAEAIEGRKFPYVYTQPAYSVLDIQVDKFSRIESITFSAKDEDLNGKKVSVAYKWDNVQCTKIYYKGKKVIKEEKFPHGLNVLPVIALYSKSNSDVLPFPPFYDLARLNCTLYNKDSELRDQERAQAFSVFYAQLGGENNNTTIGPHSMIDLPIDPNVTIEPGYASPNPQILSHLIESNKEIVESIFQIANQNGIVGLKQTSGIAESYRFQATNNQLKATAKIAEEYERKLAHLVGLYINQEIDYQVQYTHNYDAFYSNMSVDEIEKVLNMDLPDQVKTELKKLATTKFLDTMDVDKLSEILKIFDGGLS